MRKAILFIVLVLSAQIARADTYPAFGYLDFSYIGCTVGDVSASLECYRRSRCAQNGINPDSATGSFVCTAPSPDVIDNGTAYNVKWYYGPDRSQSFFDNFTKSYSCDYGGTLSGSSCINADPCTSPEVRDSVTGECKAPPPVICQTTPTTTTSGSTQTLYWETSPTGLSPCEPHSITCDYPLAVNSTDKRCDLSCPDGSTVNVSAGEQCPHECKNQVNGSIITIRTWDELTQACKNTEIKQCDGQLQIADADSGDCLPKPGAKDCGNGIVVMEPVECSSKPDDSQMITCLDGLKIYPPRVCNPLPPSKEDCNGGIPGFFNGVAVCYGADGTATPAPDGSQSPSDDKYNPQGYKAGVACNASYSYPCDPSLPVVNTPGLTGIEQCGPGTFFTCSDKHDKPVIPALHPVSPSPTTATTTTTGTNTTIITNSDGSTSTQTSTTNNTGTTTTTGGSTAGLATEDTAREIASRLGGKAAGKGGVSPGAGMGQFTGRGKNTNPNLGKWYEATADTYEGVFQTNVNSVKDSPLMGFSQKIFNVSIPGGTCPIWTIPAVMNMQAIPVSPLCSDFMDSIFPIISALVQASAVFMVFRIIISGFKS